MANQLTEADSAARVRFRSRHFGDRYRAEPRAANRLTDRRLLQKVRAANGLAKRAFDVVVAALALVFLSPALLLIAAIIKLTDGGPVFFSHTRLGRHGQRFACVKFRTMAVDSAERLEAHLSADPDAAAEWEATQKLRDDPRITKFGALLRKSSFDELPQLFNVLRGEMSLIGPRPITRDELNRYGRDRRFYLLVRPGMTGLWQVSGRSSTSYERRVAFDREYLEDWSWLGELWILLMTIPAVLRTEDAC
ncbi:MAG: sugar transferase [Hyphomonadaceae bacterium]|nr:sugar transferase [Hyphomonadaceae bacterium]